MYTSDRKPRDNELPHPDRRSPLAIVIEVVREPMLLLLLGAGALYLIFGNLGEALVLLALAMMSIMITVIQGLAPSVCLRRCAT